VYFSFFSCEKKEKYQKKEKQTPAQCLRRRSNVNTKMALTVFVGAILFLKRFLNGTGSVDAISYRL